MKPISERKPGRSFRDAERPLGEALLERSARTTAPTQEDFASRERQTARQVAANPGGVAERAKVIGVLRKAEEFMSTSNPHPGTPQGVRRALELAAGRAGLTYAEYRILVDADPELAVLEQQVVDDARRRAGIEEPERVPVAAESGTVPVTRDIDVAAQPVTTFARIFVPVDFSMRCHRALATALDLRRMYGSAVCVFHGVESSGADDFLGGIGSPAVHGDWVSEGEGRVRRFLANVVPDADPGIEVRATVEFTERTLCREAELWGATLVVIHAEKGRFRSFADRLLHQIGVPVLVVPC